jgi:hypothetical protein
VAQQPAGFLSDHVLQRVLAAKAMGPYENAMNLIRAAI